MIKRPGPTSFFLVMLLAGAARAAGDTSGSQWTQFRGGPMQQGIAAETLPADLAPAWTFEIADGVEATAAIAGETVYVNGLDGTLYALKLADGKVRWKYETGEEIKSSPLVLDGSVYFGDELGRFHAVDAGTGKARWTIEVDASVTSSANLSPAGCLLFGSYDNFLYCVSPEDGKIVWKVETEGYVHGTPAVADGKAVSSGCDGYLRVVDAASGETVKKIELGGYVAASPAIRDGHTFVGTFESEVLSIDMESGEVAWRYKHAKREFPYYSSAAVTADRVIVGGRDKMVRALAAATGEEIWTWTSRARIDASPVVSGDRVFVADQTGKLLALALDDGEVLWSFDTGDSFSASPAIGGGRLVISTESGKVYAFAGTAELAR